MKLLLCIFLLYGRLATSDSIAEDTRLVSSAKELGGALRNESVTNVIVKGLSYAKLNTWRWQITALRVASSLPWRRVLQSSKPF